IRRGPVSTAGAGRAAPAGDPAEAVRFCPVPPVPAVPAPADRSGPPLPVRLGAEVLVCPVGRPGPDEPPDPAGGTLGGIDTGRSAVGRFRAEVRTGALPVCCVGSLIGSRPRLPPMLRTTVRHQGGC